MDIYVIRQYHLIGEHRFQQRARCVLLVSESLSGICILQPCHRTHIACSNGIRRPVFFSRIYPDLLDLFCPVLRTAVRTVIRVRRHDCILHVQRTAGDLHVSQPHPLTVPADLEHTRTELCRIYFLQTELRYDLKQLVYPLHLQCRTEAAREYPALCDTCRYAAVIKTAVFQELFYHLFVTHRDLLLPGCIALNIKLHAPAAKASPQLSHYRRSVRTVQIHFIYKNKNRQPVFFHKLPQRSRMPLDSVLAAYHQYRDIQHLQRPFHFRGKVHMSRCVQQHECRTVVFQLCLL